MRVQVTSPPAAEPVSLPEAKLHCRVDHDKLDAAFERQIKAARRDAEHRTGRSFVTQTLQVVLDAREGAPPIVLPRGPVQQVTKFEAFDLEANEWVVVPTSAYYLAGDRLCMAEGSGATSWPSADRLHDAYRLTYVAGYGAPAQVPDDLKEALLKIVADMYSNPETLVGAGLVLTRVPRDADEILQSYINYQLG